ncbi:TPA: hypothetical protein ACWXAD_004979 [Klebsiella quasipneumoniae subsp. similipneumoniae]
MEQDFSGFDFFGVKPLDGKSATFYVRGGKSFMWVGGDRYNFADNCDGPIANDMESIAGFKFSRMELDKDITEMGVLFLWQKEEYYVLAFIPDNRKLPPKILKAGNSLQEI